MIEAQLRDQHNMFRISVKDYYTMSMYIFSIFGEQINKTTKRAKKGIPQPHLAHF